jgi:hypothetical protein
VDECKPLVLGRTGAARLATSVARRVHSIVLDGMGPHVRELVEAHAVPQNITLPRQLDEYGVQGVHGYFRQGQV